MVNRNARIRKKLAKQKAEQSGSGVVSDSNVVANRSASISDSGRQNDVSGPALSTDILLDPKTLSDDLTMVGREVRSKRWKTWSDRKKNWVVNRLMRIASKKNVIVATSEGPCPDESKADGNAIRAMSLLVNIESQIQKDEHHKENLDKPTSVVNQNINNNEYHVLVVRDNGRGPRQIEHQ